MQDYANAEIEDLTDANYRRKLQREDIVKSYLLPEEVFVKNRTVSKENQEKLLRYILRDEEFAKYKPLITHAVDVENFLKYRWITKILTTFCEAGLFDEITSKKYSAVANNYYQGGFRELLSYEIKQFQKGKYKTVDRAYSEAFKSLKDILEHKIPKILSLFESIIVCAAQQKYINIDIFTLSHVRRYYETGVKSPLGEALIEFGFPTDAIRRIEDKYSQIIGMTVSEAKAYCRNHFSGIQQLLDPYENALFIRAMRTFQ